MINHFGKKPESGGRPPKESRIRGKRPIRAGYFAQEKVRFWIVEEEELLRVEKITTVASE